LNLSDFDYDLPERFIAQTPTEPRDSSRLLVLDRSSGSIEHRRFREIGEFLRPGDVLVLNDTRVIPARLWAHKARTGGKVELLLLSRKGAAGGGEARTWEALAGGSGARVGTVLEVDGQPGLHATVLEDLGAARRLLEFSQPLTPLLDRVGHVPLPPYIHAPLRDGERYQTVYARLSGSAAAPTAGLHFTPELLLELKRAGVGLAYVTLHIGLDTFAPVTEERVEEHVIHTEWCQLTAATAQQINAARLAGGRVVAVGTTAVRVLESAAAPPPPLSPRPPLPRGEGETAPTPALPREAGEGECPWQAMSAWEGPTSLFIYPGYPFRAVDALVTNFHLPRSTLLMLVSAFAGRERILAAYETAMREGYRFYSFGDAMLIL
jgi:S-adenosylmethionine:tRNA ribosyltransferase-isomerase